MEILVTRTSMLQTTVGKRFHKNLTTKINDRRNVAVISLALYLFEKDSLNKSSRSSYPFTLETKIHTQQFGTRLLKQLFGIDTPAENSDHSSCTTDEMNFEQELKLKVENRWGTASQKAAPSTETAAIQKVFVRMIRMDNEDHCLISFSTPCAAFLQLQLKVNETSR